MRCEADAIDGAVCLSTIRDGECTTPERHGLSLLDTADMLWTAMNRLNAHGSPLDWGISPRTPDDRMGAFWHAQEALRAVLREHYTTQRAVSDPVSRADLLLNTCFESSEAPGWFVKYRGM